MGLEDRFFPDDGSLLTRYDHFMIRSAGNVGKMYQELTGESYKDLVKDSSGVATLGFLSVGCTGNVVSFLFAGFPYENYISPKFMTPLEEEMDQERRGFPKNGKKFARLFISFFGLAMAHLGYSHLTEAKEFSFYTPIYAGYLLFGLSTLPWNFANYLSLAHLPKAPERTIFERAKDTLADMVRMPEQVPI